MRYTLYGLGQGVCAQGDKPFVVTCDDAVVDVSVSALKAGIQIGWPLRTALATCRDIAVIDQDEGMSQTMERVYQILWNASPYLSACPPNSFFLQIPGTEIPLAEVREIMLHLNQELSDEQRFRVGLAENPWLAEALISWSRVERVPGALYLRVKCQQLIVSPGLANCLRGGELETQWIGQMPIRVLWFLDAEKRRALEQLGIKRFADVTAVDDTLLRSHFGKEAWMWKSALDQQPGGKVHVNYPPIERRLSWRAPLDEAPQLTTVDAMMESMAAELSVSLQRISAGALGIGMSWRTNRDHGRFEKAAKRPLYQPFPMIAELFEGRMQMIGEQIELLDVYVYNLRPLESVQAGFVLYNDAFYPAFNAPRARLEDVRTKLVHRFPNKLQIGAKATFRERRLAAIQGRSHT